MTFKSAILRRHLARREQDPTITVEPAAIKYAH
jgi:hypothetical protein